MNRDAETVPARHETPDVTELRRLAEAATPGPWYLDGPWWYGDDDSAYCISTAEDAGRIAVTIAPPRYIFGGEREVRDANARFIAAANPAAVLALLADTERAEAKLAAARREGAWEAIEHLGDELGWDHNALCAIRNPRVALCDCPALTLGAMRTRFNYPTDKPATEGNRA